MVMSTLLHAPGAEAHSNLGVTFQELGRLDEAEVTANQAIILNPHFAEAHYNLGNTLQEKGRLAGALASYNHAIRLKPDYREANQNILELLTSFNSKNESPQPVIKVDQEIKDIYFENEITGFISDEEIVDLFGKSFDIINKHLSKLSKNNPSSLNLNDLIGVKFDILKNEWIVSNDKSINYLAQFSKT